MISHGVDCFWLKQGCGYFPPAFDARCIVSFMDSPPVQGSLDLDLSDLDAVPPFQYPDHHGDSEPTSGQALLESERRSQPRSRVKRWRRDPPVPVPIMTAHPKSSVVTPRHLLNRWEDGKLDPNCKPWGGSGLSVGGLAPPISHRGVSVGELPRGGLPNAPSSRSLSTRSHIICLPTCISRGNAQAARC